MYGKLRMASLACIQAVRVDEEAMNVFESDVVRDAMCAVQNSVLRALDLITFYYDKSMLHTLSPTFCLIKSNLQSVSRPLKAMLIASLL